MESMSTYSEARNEYLKQLSTWIVPYMIQHFRNLWSEAQKMGGNKREMIVFQEKCAEIPKWNQDIIDSNVSKLLESCRCDYLEELMAAVFIAHTKVLIAIRVSSKHKKLQITLPKLDHFLHRIFSECARSFWKTPFLFLDDQKPIEMQKNLLQAEALCSESIAAAVRTLLPIKNILNEYLSEDVMSSEPVVEEAENVKTGGSTIPQASPIKNDIKLPEVTKPEVTTPEVTTPEVTTPEVTTPEVTTPEVITPEVITPEVITSEVITSEVTTPEVTEVTTPKVTTPEVTPELIISEVKPPELEMPVSQPEEIVIDTESGVHFSDYDNVFEEQTGTFEYNPKNDDSHLVKIMDGPTTSLTSDTSVTNLEASGSIPSLGPMMADEILE